MSLPPTWRLAQLVTPMAPAHWGFRSISSGGSPRVIHTSRRPAVSTQKNSYCLRRRLIFGLIFAVFGLSGGLAFFAPWVDQADLAPLWGTILLVGTILFTVNYFKTSYICVTRSGITRTEWLGLVKEEFPFAALSRIELGTRPSVPLLAQVVEIKIGHRTLILDRRSYGDENLQRMLNLILHYYPQAPVAGPAKEYAMQARRTN